MHISHPQLVCWRSLQLTQNPIIIIFVYKYCMTYFLSSITCYNNISECKESLLSVCAGLTIILTLIFIFVEYCQKNVLWYSIVKVSGTCSYVRVCVEFSLVV